MEVFNLQESVIACYTQRLTNKISLCSSNKLQLPKKTKTT
jgi:hypothetical protein